jgi:hypothetical protein
VMVRRADTLKGKSRLKKTRIVSGFIKMKCWFGVISSFTIWRQRVVGLDASMNQAILGASAERSSQSDE